MQNITERNLSVRKLAVKCLRDSKTGHKVVVDKHEASLKLPYVNCDSIDKFIMTEGASLYYLYEAMRALTNLKSLEITNQVCEEFQNWYLENFETSKSSFTSKITNKIQNIFLDTLDSVKCIGAFFNWFVYYFETQNVKVIRFPSKNLVVTSFFANILNNVLQLCRRIETISIIGKFIKDSPELLLKETHLPFLTKLEIIHTGRTDTLSTNYSANILLDVSSSPLRKISINLPILGKDCHYYSHFRSTLSDLNATVHVGDLRTFDLTDCFEDMPHLDKLQLRLESNHCHEPGGSILIYGVSQKFLIAQSVLVTIQSPCNLSVDDSCNLDFEFMKDEALYVVRFSKGAALI